MKIVALFSFALLAVSGSCEAAVRPNVNSGTAIGGGSRDRGTSKGFPKHSGGGTPSKRSLHARKANNQNFPSKDFYGLETHFDGDIGALQIWYDPTDACAVTGHENSRSANKGCILMCMKHPWMFRSRSSGVGTQGSDVTIKFPTQGQQEGVSFTAHSCTDINSCLVSLDVQWPEDNEKTPQLCYGGQVTEGWLGYSDDMLVEEHPGNTTVMGLLNRRVISTTNKDAQYDLMIKQTDEKWYPHPLNSFTYISEMPLAAREAKDALKEKILAKAKSEREKPVGGNANVGYIDYLSKEIGAFEIWHQSTASGSRNASTYMCMEHPFVFKNTNGETQTIGCHPDKEYSLQRCYFTKQGNCPKGDLCMSERMNIDVREPGATGAVSRFCFLGPMDESWLGDLGRDTYSPNNIETITFEAGTMMELLMLTGTSTTDIYQTSILLYTDYKGLQSRTFNSFTKFKETPVAVN
ncbi:hypothetical protein ACQY0O_006086 [Thecaphora frezii]